VAAAGAGAFGVGVEWVVGAGATGAGVTGVAGVVVMGATGVVVTGTGVCEEGFSWARICSAWVMKACQIIAGNVPPSTGWPLYWVLIETSLFGYPTHTATVICGVQPTNQASP
jgi:hypothetical protein